MPEKEYGAERQRAGWVKMVHPDLPDNDPIDVVEASVPHKLNKGWVAVELDAEQDADFNSASSWELTEDEG
jgi:hypothetical protein